jgi:small subunit ribosomal protein S4e
VCTHKARMTAVAGGCSCGACWTLIFVGSRCVALSRRGVQFKLCRITKQALTSKAIPYIVTHDGRTIRYPDPIIKVGDTVKLDLATGKVIDVLPFNIGNVVVITQGRNTGRIGVLVNRDRHPGSFDIVHVRDSEGNEFATRLRNAFIIGHGAEPAIALPRGKGIKRTIFEQRAARLKH